MPSDLFLEERACDEMRKPSKFRMVRGAVARREEWVTGESLHREGDGLGTACVGPEGAVGAVLAGGAKGSQWLPRGIKLPPPPPP